MTSFVDGRPRLHLHPIFRAAVLALAAAVLAWALVAGARPTTPDAGSAGSPSPVPAPGPGSLLAPLARLAANSPTRRAEVIVQLKGGTSLPSGRALVRSLGGRPGPSLPIINGLSARISAGAARRLAARSTPGSPGTFLTSGHRHPTRPPGCWLPR